MKEVNSKKMKSNIIKTFKNSKVKKFSTDDFDYEENDFLTESSSKPTNLFSKWYDEIKGSGDIESEMLSPADIQSLKKQASYVFNDAVVKNKSKPPKSLSNSDYAWVRTVMSKGTQTDKVAAYTLLIQESPIYNLNLLKTMVDMVKIGKKKECFMAVDTLCELFINDLLPPNRKLVPFSEQPLSRLDELTSGNAVSKNRRLLLWYFEDQLKSIYADFVQLLSKISHDSVEANKQKIISAMYKLLEGNPEMENMLLNNIVNKLGDPSRKVGSKVIYVLMKLLETHPNMKEVVANAVEKVIFRNNISKRAQYYSICLLSQYCFISEESNVAKKLISIYLSLFKASVKTGDIDSRMMRALLSGVKRAFPYLKENFEVFQEQVNTLYKIIHLSQPNISIQALSLVYLISSQSNSHVDRFYSVLYKKIGEVEMFYSINHAMLINLLFRALKKDTEKSRICAFIKRLLQFCAFIPVPTAAGVLILISQLLKLKNDILLTESVPEATSPIKIEEDSDDGEEYYKDVTEDKVSQKESSSLKKVKEDNVKLASNFFNVNPPEDSKVWSNPDKSLEHPSASEIRNYNPYVRNPIYSGAHNCLCYELFNLAQHFHPTISLFAQKIMKGEVISYSGDPFLDFTLIRFLDKFSFKNPKVIKPEEERRISFEKYSKKKYYASTPIRRLRANTSEYLRVNEKSIPVDEIFLYRYMKQKAQTKLAVQKADESDVDSVKSEEFDELVTDIMEGKKDDIDFLSEVGQLPKKDKTKKQDKTIEEESDFENDESGGEDLIDGDESDGGSSAQDFEGDEIDDFSEGEELEGSDVDEAELEASGFKLPKLPCLKKGNKKAKKHGKKDYKDNLFASAEEFAELLEEDDYNEGDSEALSNKDRAGIKQLKWETQRDKWINKKTFRSKGTKSSKLGKKQSKGLTTKKKKWF